MKKLIIGWCLLHLGVCFGALDIMQLSEEQLLALIPDQTPIDAPDPAGPTYLRHHKQSWGWRPDRPDELVSPLDGMVYPNARYAMSRKANYLNYSGGKIEVSFYEGAVPEGDLRGNPHPTRYFFSGAIDREKYLYLRGQLPKLVDRFYASGDPVIARRIALILDGFAQRYPHYLLSDGRGINNYYISTGGPYLFEGILRGTPGKDRPYSWTAGRFYGPWMGEIRKEFIDAYVAIKSSSVLDALGRERGTDVRVRIERDLIRKMVSFVMDMPWDQQMGNNLVEYLAQVVAAGKAIGEPEFAHIAYRYLRDVMYTYGKEGPHGVGYTYDLHHPEGNQGHYGVMRGIYTVYQALEGYSDPPGYRGKTDGLHLQNISLQKDLPLFDRMVYVPYAYTLPDGGVNPLNDTMGNLPRGTFGSGIRSLPLKESRCRLLPGLGHAVLGAESGADQVQLQVQFSEQGANHHHKDCLSIMWFAHGRELSSDIGYQRNRLRHWSAHALSHNTVVVNREDQNEGDTFGNIQYYEPNLPGLSAIQVDAPGAYRKQGVELYQRTVILNTIDARRPYFVDLFEVEGGAVHDYAMHGSVLGDMVGQSNMAMGKMAGERPLLEAGEEWREPTGFSEFNVYGLFTNVSHATTRDPFYIDFDFGKTEGGTRVHVLPDQEMDVYLGETPGLRSAGHYNDAEVYKWSMPHFILRTKTGASRFLAVYDMHGTSRGVTSVHWLEDGRLQITAEARVDTYRFDQEQNSFRLEATADGKTPLVYEVNHTAYRGTILGGSRKLGGYPKDSLIVDQALPEGEVLRGHWVLVDHPGVDVCHAYEIKQVTRQGSFYEIELMSDSGLNIGAAETEEVFSPWRTFDGDNQFTVYQSRCSIPVPEIKPNTGRWDRLKPQRFIPFMDEIEVSMKGEGIIGYTLDQQELHSYEGPFTLRESAVVMAAVAVRDAILPLPRVEQRFVAALQPVVPSRVGPGVRVQSPGEENVQPDFTPRALGANTLSSLLKIEAAGIYTFYLQARHDATLRIGDLDLLDTTGLGPYRTWSVKVPLQAGFHAIEVTYNQASGRFDPELNVSYAPPREEKRPIPDSLLFCTE